MPDKPLPDNMDDATAEIKKLRAELDKTTGAANSLAQAIGKLSSIGAQGRGIVKDDIDTYGAYQKVLEETTGTVTTMLKTIENTVSKIPGIGGIMKKGLGGVNALVGGLGSVTSAIGDMPKQYTMMMDSFTTGLRSFEKEMFDVHKGFGGTIDEAKAFADTMRLAADNPLAKSLHMTTNEMNQLRRATDGTATTQKQLATVVQTGAGAIELFGAATAFAASSGIDLNKGAQMLNTLLN